MRLVVDELATVLIFAGRSLELCDQAAAARVPLDEALTMLRRSAGTLAEIRGLAAALTAEAGQRYLSASPTGGAELRRGHRRGCRDLRQAVLLTETLLNVIEGHEPVGNLQLQINVVLKTVQESLARLLPAMQTLLTKKEADHA
jgi:hypothetical protein